MLLSLRKRPNYEDQIISKVFKNRLLPLKKDLLTFQELEVASRLLGNEQTDLDEAPLSEIAVLQDSRSEVKLEPGRLGVPLEPIEAEI